MEKPSICYELSPEEDSALEEIFDYTERKFVLDQAIAYVSAFDGAFDRLIENPKFGKAREEIRAELRSLVWEQHVVFYRMIEDHIRIVRILHGSRDVRKFLP